MPTAIKKIGDDELRIGWASWDDGTHKQRSVKYCYRDKADRISRASPEVPVDRLVDMAVYAIKEREFTSRQLDALRKALDQK